MTDKDKQAIDDYVLNLLQDVEKQALMQRIKQEPELHTYLTEQQQALEAYTLGIMAERAPLYADNRLKKNSPIRISGWLHYAAAIWIPLGLGLVVVLMYFHFHLEQQIVNLQSKLASQTASIVALQNQIVYTNLIADKFTKTQLVKGTDKSPSTLCTVWVNNMKQILAIHYGNLPSPEKGKQYQLWMIIDEKPISLGVLPLESQWYTVENITIKDLPIFAISLEPIGGSIQPTTNAIYAVGS